MSDVSLQNYLHPICPLMRCSVQTNKKQQQVFGEQVVAMILIYAHFTEYFTQGFRSMLCLNVFVARTLFASKLMLN